MPVLKLSRRSSIEKKSSRKQSVRSIGEREDDDSVPKRKKKQ